MARRIARGVSSPGRYCLQLETFRGIDLNNAPGNVDISRSPDAPNMIRGETGKVRKRMGYKSESRVYAARINGVFLFKGIRLVHAGKVLYWTTKAGIAKTYSGLADTRSQARALGGKLCLLDGQCMLLFDGEAITRAQDSAYIPTLLIAKRPGPNSGGTVLEPLNLLSRKWIEQYQGDASGKVYYLSVQALASDAPLVETLNASGTWVTTATSQYTFSAANGTVTFTTAPAKPTVDGVDNVRITVAKDRAENLAKVNKCTLIEAYGVGGNPDRLFLSGNPDCPGDDFYCDLNDPTYFGDTWFSSFGQDGTSIVGYSVLGNSLLTHKNSEASSGIIVRSGTLINDQAAFPVVNTLSGEAAIGSFSFGNLGKEPFFLTRRGVYSVTAAELTGEKFSQQRSFYIAPALMAEPDLTEGCALVWKDFYLLAVNNRVYILDGQQKSYSPSEPYSSHQCEAYLWENIPARVLWEESDTLCFGTEDGRICRFSQDSHNPASYSDDGAAIHAHWDTPDLSGSYFFRRKTFRSIAVRLFSAPITSLKMRVQRQGMWHDIKSENRKFRYFDWSYINLADMVFNSDRTPNTIIARIRVRGVDKARFRLENSEKDEPFGLYSLALEYSEGRELRQ